MTDLRDLFGKGLCRRIWGQKLPSSSLPEGDDFPNSGVLWKRVKQYFVKTALLYLVSGINCRLLSVNHALISQILNHPILRVAFHLLVQSTHHSHHPSPLHSFIPGLTLFSVDPSHRRLFFFYDWLHGFSGLSTDTNEHIRFCSVVFTFFPLFSFWLHVVD